MKILLIVFYLVIPIEAFAYLGPGLAVGTIGTLIGIILAVCFSFCALLWYPLKSLLKKIFRTKPPEADTSINQNGEGAGKVDNCEQDIPLEN